MQFGTVSRPQARAREPRAWFPSKSWRNGRLSSSSTTAAPSVSSSSESRLPKWARRLKRCLSGSRASSTRPGPTPGTSRTSWRSRTPATRRSSKSEDTNGELLDACSARKRSKRLDGILLQEYRCLYVLRWEPPHLGPVHEEHRWSPAWRLCKPGRIQLGHQTPGGRQSLESNRFAYLSRRRLDSIIAPSCQIVIYIYITYSWLVWLGKKIKYRPEPVYKQRSLLGMDEVHLAGGFQGLLEWLSREKQVLHRSWGCTRWFLKDEVVCPLSLSIYVCVGWMTESHDRCAEVWTCVWRVLCCVFVLFVLKTLKVCMPNKGSIGAQDIAQFCSHTHVFAGACGISSTVIYL